MRLGFLFFFLGFFVTRPDKRNPNFSTVVYVNNVHITAEYVTTEKETAFVLQKGNTFFIINVNLCFYTKAAEREKFACRETTSTRRRSLVPAVLPAPGLCILRCVGFVLRVISFFSVFVLILIEGEKGEEEPPQQADAQISSCRTGAPTR